MAHAYVWVMSHVNASCHSHMNESCHTWMRYGTHTCHTNKQVYYVSALIRTSANALKMSHIWMSHVTLIWLSHVTHTWMCRVTHVCLRHVTQSSLTRVASTNALNMLHVWTSHGTNITDECVALQYTATQCNIYVAHVYTDSYHTHKQICYAYVDPRLPQQMRHMELSRTFMFDCACGK